MIIMIEVFYTMTMTMFTNKRPAGIASLRGARQAGHIANTEGIMIVIIIISMSINIISIMIIIMHRGYSALSYERLRGNFLSLRRELWKLRAETFSTSRDLESHTYHISSGKIEE